MVILLRHEPLLSNARDAAGRIPGSEGASEHGTPEIQCLLVVEEFGPRKVEPGVCIADTKPEGQPVRGVHQAFVFEAAAIDAGVEPVVDAGEVGAGIMRRRRIRFWCGTARGPLAVAQRAPSFAQRLRCRIETDVVQSPRVVLRLSTAPARVRVRETGVKVAQIGDDQVGAGRQQVLIHTMPADADTQP